MGYERLEFGSRAVVQVVHTNHINSESNAHKAELANYVSVNGTKLSCVIKTGSSDTNKNSK
jgi:hypothetical protein